MPPEQREVNGECRSRTMCVVSVPVILLGAVTLPYPLAPLCQITPPNKGERGGREGGRGKLRRELPRRVFSPFLRHNGLGGARARMDADGTRPDARTGAQSLVERTNERATAKAMTLLSCCQIQRSLAQGRPGRGAVSLQCPLSLPSFLPFIRLLTPFDTF